MELEIQIVPRVSITVKDYEMPKQPSHQSDFYGDDPALVVVVNPFSTKRSSCSISISLRVRHYDYRNTTYIHLTQEKTRKSLKNLVLIPIKLSRPDPEDRHVANVTGL